MDKKCIEETPFEKLTADVLIALTEHETGDLVNFLENIETETQKLGMMKDLIENELERRELQDELFEREEELQKKLENEKKIKENI